MNATPGVTAEARDRDLRVIHYTVNADDQQTTTKKLTGRQILENAGFTPGEDHVLTRAKGGKEIGLDAEEAISEGEAFLAKFRGITPVS
jgi:hypothetical protein